MASLVSALVNTVSATSERAKALQAGVVAMLLGAIIVGIVDFASLPAIHDAAHDVRHANIAPCH